MNTRTVSLSTLAICVSLFSFSSFADDKAHATASTKPAARKVASVGDKPSTLEGETLVKRILKMGECDFLQVAASDTMVDSEYVYTIKFEENRRKGKTLSAVRRLSDEETAYAYKFKKKEMLNPIPYRGTWELTEDGKHIQIKVAPDETSTVLFFGTLSYYQHRCYDDIRGAGVKSNAR